MISDKTKNRKLFPKRVEVISEKYQNPALFFAEVKQDESMSLEEQIREYQAVVSQIGELEEKKQLLGQAILEQMSAKTLSMAGCTVRRYDRLIFRTPLEKARELGAVKTEEVLDKEALKKLYQAGEPVPGVSTTSFIQVSLKKGEERL